MTASSRGARRLSAALGTVGSFVATFTLANDPPLTAAQRDSLEAGEQLYVETERPESSWPAVQVRILIDAPPEDAAAVFVDFEAQVNRLPSLTKARISRVISPSVVEVDYTLGLPIVSDEDYTVRNTISRDTRGGYRVDWVMVRSTSAKATVGHAAFQPYTTRAGRKGTLLEYSNFVTPGSRLAGLGFIRSRALERVRETAGAIRAQVARERRDQALMQRRLVFLRAAVASPAVTKP